MIFFITKQGKEFTLKLFLETFGKSLAEDVTFVSYEKLFGMRSFSGGTYIFSDLERLTPDETDNATVIWSTLSDYRQDVTLLNHPARSMRRYELLRNLHKLGVNDFNVYRLTDIKQPVRYPVFIRSESDHTANLTPLLYCEKELRNAIYDLVESGHNRDNKIIVEFTETRESDGLYCLYNDFIIGSRVIAKGIEQSDKWVNKGYEFDPDDCFVLRNQRYVEENPNEPLVRPIFDIAGIQYGRIDYAKVDGQLRIFEINTNPYVLELEEYLDPKWRPANQHFSSQLVEAFHEINGKNSSYTLIDQKERLKPYPPSFHHRLRMIVHFALRSFHLLRYEASIMSALRRVEDALTK